MDNVILVLILVAVGVVVAYKKVPAVQEFIDSKLLKKTQKPVEASTKPVETISAPVNTPVPTSTEKPAVEPVKQPERSFADLFSASHTKAPSMTTKNPSDGTNGEDAFAGYPVGLPPVIGFGATKNQFSMYYRVQVPKFVFTNISISPEWTGQFTMTMVPHPNVTQPHANLTWVLADLTGKVVASGHGDTSAMGAVKFRSDKSLPNKIPAVSPGSYTLTITSSSVDTYLLCAPTE